MKLLLLSLVAAFGLPVQAEVDPKIHKDCIEAVDYLGCVKAMTGEGGSGGINSDSLLSTYEALRKLSSRTGVGINKQRFSDMWGDTAFLLEDEISKNGGKTRKLLQDTFDSYQDIQHFWNCIFDTTYASLMPRYCLSIEFQQRNPNITKQLIDYIGQSTEVTYLVKPLMTKASLNVKLLGFHINNN